MKAPLLFVLIGVMVAFAAVETGVRAIDESLPDPRQWPTPETEIKSAQLSSISDDQPAVDVVFIGSSAVEAGLDPVLFERIAGMSAYNAAHPFSSPLSNEIWLRDIVLPTVEPSVVVIGLGVWPYESTLEDDLLAAELERVTTRDPAPTGVALIDRRRQLRSWSDSAVRANQVMSGVITARGHQTAYYDMAIGPDGTARFDESEPASMSEDNLDALRRTIEMLEGRGIGVALLLEPVGCPPVVEVCTRFDLGSHPGRVIAEEFDLPLIDAASPVWDTESYADTAHFNQAGVTALTEFVARELMKYETSSSAESESSDTTP